MAATSANDPDLVARLKKGERSAFAELVTLYQDAVRGYAAMWAPSRYDADDIAQEVFLIALRDIASHDASRDLKWWLLGITRNLTRQSWKRVRRNQSGAVADALAQLLEERAIDVYRERMEAHEPRRAAMDECIRNLPQNSRQIFMSYVMEEKSSAELASVLETTEGTVRSWIARIRRGLRDCIQRRVALEVRHE